MKTPTNNPINDPCPKQHRLIVGPPEKRPSLDYQALQKEEECTDRQAPLEQNTAAEGITNSIIIGPCPPKKFKNWFETRTP